MQITPIWVLNIPVLSTAHMRDEHALEEMTRAQFTPVAQYAHGGFVYVQDEAACVDKFAWFAPVARWAREREFEWVRFDSVGDEIDELPTYEW